MSTNKNSDSESSVKKSYYCIKDTLNGFYGDRIERNNFLPNNNPVPKTSYKIEIKLDTLSKFTKYRLQILIDGNDLISLLPDQNSLDKSTTTKYASKYFHSDRYKLLVDSNQYLKNRVVNNIEPFRKCGPLYSDIEKGCWVYSNIGMIEKLINILKKSKRILITGPSASGKTVLGRLIAFNWMKDFPVAFLDLKAKDVVFNYSLLIDESEKLSKTSNSSLLIIDDASRRIDELNQFAEYVKFARLNLHIIFIFRDNYTTYFTGFYLNNFESIYCENLGKINQTKDIVRSYFRADNKASSNGALISFFLGEEKNLWILAYIIKSLARGKIQTLNWKDEINWHGVLNEVERDLLEIERRKNRQTLRIKLLISLSILYRYEILTNYRFLCERFEQEQCNNIRDILEDLHKEGEIIRSEEGDQYGLTHSSLAKLYFVFTSYGRWQDDRVYGDENAFIEAYFTSEYANNWPKLINNISARTKIKKICVENLSRKINSCDDLYTIGQCIGFVLYKTDGLERKLIERVEIDKLCGKIENSDDLCAIGTCVGFVCQCIEIKGIDLWNKTKAAWLNKISKEDHLESIGKCVDITFRSSELIGKKLINLIEDLMIEKIINSNDLKDIGEIIRLINKVYTPFDEKNWDRIGDGIIQKINNHDKLYDIGKCIESVVRIRPHIYNELNHTNLFSKINNTENLVYELTYCLPMFLKIMPGKGEELFSQINIRAFSKIVVNSNDPLGTCLLIQFFGDVSPSFATKFIKEIKIENFAHQALTITEHIPLIIRKILQFSNATAKKFCKELESLNLYKQNIDKKLGSDIEKAFKLVYKK